MKNILLLLIVFLSFSTITIAQSNSNKAVLEIFVNTKGDIVVKDKNLTFQKLEREIKRIRRKKGVIHYSTVLTSDVAKKASTKVIQLIAKYELPVKYYTDKTFTEIADW